MQRRFLILGVVTAAVVAITATTDAATPEASAAGKPVPRFVKVPDGKGGFRVDHIDRPTNGTPGLNKRIELAERAKSDAAFAAAHK
jgi:hypothetical protein